MKTKKLDAVHVLRVLSDIRKGIPVPDRDAPRPIEDGRVAAVTGMPVRTAEDFEWAAVMEGIGSLLADVSAVVRQKREQLHETALRVYYATEELSHDPENAHLIPHVERMREAYERDYGRAIPEKEG